MRYQVLLIRGDDGWIVAECPSLPGCVSQGKTRDEALANIREAMEGWLAVDTEQSGFSAPQPRNIEIAEVEVAGVVPPLPVVSGRQALAAFEN